MKAYVARKSDGSIAKGWILRSSRAIHSAACRSHMAETASERIEEVPVDVVMGALSDDGAKNDGKRLSNNLPDTRRT